MHAIVSSVAYRRVSLTDRAFFAYAPALGPLYPRDFAANLMVGMGKTLLAASRLVASRRRRRANWAPWRLQATGLFK